MVNRFAFGFYQIAYSISFRVPEFPRRLKPLDVVGFNSLNSYIINNDFFSGLMVLTFPTILETQFFGAIMIVSFLLSFWILGGLQWSP